MRALSLGWAIFAAAAAAAAPAAPQGARLRPGEVAAPFTAKDLEGREAAPFAGESKAVVIAFSAVHCPVASVLAPRLAELGSRYAPRGVPFFLVNSNPKETAGEIGAAAAAAGIAFPVLADPGQAVADRFGVERSAEVLLFDGARRLRYRGAVDDQYGTGTRKAKAERHYLIEALDSVLAGEEVRVRETAAPGCLLGRVRSASRPAAAADPTYHADVAPILAKNCVECHRPGEIGPMPLESFEDAEGISRMIGEVVEQGRMPPWHADARFGAWSNARRLAEADKQTILRWVRAGAPEGSRLSPPPPPPPAADPGRWHIGKPDLVLRIPKQAIPAQGVIDYRYLPVPTGLAEDRWVARAEVHAGNRQVVHHVLVFCQYPESRRREEPPIDGGLEGGYFASLVPGERPNEWPEGAGKLLPAGAKLLFQMHYTANGSPTEDVSEIGLVFHREIPKKTVVTRGIAQRKLRIEPGDAAATFQSSWRVPKEIEILSFMPHMHFRGKSFLYEVVRPEGSRETLLEVPRYDFNWQATYRCASPVRIPAGSTIRCTAVFDNSAANPGNPDPRARVKWGNQSWDEMLIGYVDYVER